MDRTAVRASRRVVRPEPLSRLDWVRSIRGRCIRCAAREDVRRLGGRSVCWRAVNPPDERSRMIKLQRLGHVLISVRDLEQSKDFYTRILGFKVLEQDPEHGGLFLSIGGLGNTLRLFPSTKPTPSASLCSQLPRPEAACRRAFRTWPV